MPDVERTESGYGFGTFKGVFTPSLLTILGVVMYLRLPWVLGSVGLLQTLVIVTLSVAITLLTGLSIAAMATNMRVGGGGAYYMISRTLGLEVGAAVGLPLFLAQALGIAFYIVGFAEVVSGYLPSLSPLVIGVGTLMAITVLAYVSADLALKGQFVILTILAVSLVSFFLGGGPRDTTAAAGDPLPAAAFWVTFAVFFPAVTGIEAGLGMSGDLKDPARSLPRGTLLAVLAGYAIYLAIPDLPLAGRRRSAGAARRLADHHARGSLARVGRAGHSRRKPVERNGRAAGRPANTPGPRPRRRAAARRRPWIRREQRPASGHRDRVRDCAPRHPARRSECDRADSVDVLPDVLRGAESRGGAGSPDRRTRLAPQFPRALVGLDPRLRGVPRRDADDRRRRHLRGHLRVGTGLSRRAAPSSPLAMGRRPLRRAGADRAGRARSAGPPQAESALLESQRPRAHWDAVVSMAPGGHRARAGRRERPADHRDRHSR